MTESPINCHCAALHISYEVILHQYTNNINRYFRDTLFQYSKRRLTDRNSRKDRIPFE